MLSVQTVITGILAVLLIFYVAGYLPIKSYLQHRHNKKNGIEIKECGYCARNNATKRCSGCKNIYYCSVKCQVSHWKYGHKKICKSGSSSNNKKSVNKPKKKKKTKAEKKQEFMKMLSSFSNLTQQTNDNDDEKDGQMVIDDKQLRIEYEQMIDENKLKRKFITYYSFKILGYDDNEIPPFEGDMNYGEQRITKNEMIDSMIMTKRMIVRDPELKHEMDKKIMRYKQSLTITK